ncbi:uncharacterized protein LOC112680799 [Sipha flava]|uniref:Uncharacterized protein LOC112680799 n=1 Tax=Sipha flava TaxID=143950 RepID=A0A8B8F8V1_9HEMI|nr:uncharacterized protein LOC112680799 [Sipha flava]
MDRVRARGARFRWGIRTAADTVRKKGKKQTTRINNGKHFIRNMVSYSTEASPQFNIKLEDIPQIIVCSNETMELRGIDCYRPGLTRLMTAVGHYYAVCKRGSSWQLFDDMKKHSTPMKSTTINPCEYLVYTI